MLGDILAQVDRASAAVRNLLDFTRVEHPVHVPMSIADVVLGACRLVANEAEIHRVDFFLEFRVESLPGCVRTAAVLRDPQSLAA